MMDDVPRTTTPSIAEGTLRSRRQPTLDVDDELQIRPWRPTDVDAVLEAFQVPDIVTWHTRHLTDPSEAVDWIDQKLQEWDAEEAADWAVVERASDRVIGRCSLHLDLAHGIAEVAYWMLPIGLRARRTRALHPQRTLRCGGPPVWLRPGGNQEIVGAARRRSP